MPPPSTLGGPTAGGPTTEQNGHPSWWCWAGACCALPAVALTLLRLAGSDRQSVVQIVSFAPFAIPVYLVAVALTVLGLLIHRRRRWLAPLSVLVLGLSLQMSWLAPLYLGATPGTAAGAEPFAVMTANLELGTGEIDDVVAAVNAHHVELLVAEEVTDQALAELQAGLGADFPYSAGSGGPPGSGTGTMIFARTPITDVTPIATTLESWAFTWAGRRVLAVHPAFSSDPDGWRQDYQLLSEAVATEHPSLMLGDFNATGDHAALRRLESSGLQDAAVVANSGWHPTWPANGAVRVLGIPVPAVVAIDHVLLADSLTALDVEVAEIGRTDHHAVIARLADRE